jgi:hypothetical protein
MIRGVLCAVMLTSIAAFSTVRPAAAQDNGQPERLKVFLDCFRCDFDFIRTEIPWVDYMRDRQDADVHVLVTQQGTGAGGEQYTLNFIGLGPFASESDTLEYTSGRDDTSDVRRRGLARTLAVGLVRYVDDTPLAAQLRVVVGEEGEVSPAPTTADVDDPWNFWVFTVRAGGEYQSESREDQRGANLEFSANRTTEMWKLDFGIEGDYNESTFEIDSVTTITSIRRSFDLNMLAVKSVGEHVSVGLEGGAESSTYGNVRSAFDGGPAVEFNVFPYSESTRRTLTALYSVGVHYANYDEITIFDETVETRPQHSLRIGYSTRQQWGSASATVNLSQYLHDTRKNRISIGGNMNVRLFRGFSLDVRADYSKVKDQLSIAKQDATPEEILLRLKQLQTNYRYNMDIGISYRFGSSFNNVVNPRFRRGFGGFRGF